MVILNIRHPSKLELDGYWHKAKALCGVGGGMSLWLNVLLLFHYNEYEVLQDSIQRSPHPSLHNHLQIRLPCSSTPIICPGLHYRLELTDKQGKAQSFLL